MNVYLLVNKWVRHSAALFLAFIAPGFAATDNQSDAFYAAIRANDLPRVDEMLKQGASANLKDDRGLTPLMYAAIAGSTDAMKLLLDKGADVNARNAFASTALMWSATDIKKVRLLVERGADVNLASKQGRTALLVAALSDNSYEIARSLIAKGADVKAVDGLKTTALIAATAGNDTDTIRAMVDAGLEVNAADSLGFTPLMNAAANRNLPAVRLLLAKGANVNAVSKDVFNTVKNGTIALGKFTPLILATAGAGADVAKVLLDAGAEINAQDVRGMTPLMLAIATDHPDTETIRLLLARGADVKPKSVAGETARDWARKFGFTLGPKGLQPDIAPAAVHASADSQTKLKPAVEKSIALLEKNGNQFFVNGGCASCHHQNITDFAVRVARAKGARIDETAAAERMKLNKAFFGSVGPSLLERLDVPGDPDLLLYAVAAMDSAAYPPDRMTDALLANLVAQQASNGRWMAPGGTPRPPVEDGDIFRTALGIRAMKMYGAPGRGAEMKERIAKAHAWLLAEPAVTAEDRNMKLFGLRWAGADRKVLQPLAKSIFAEQRPDGGWAQRAELESDAYATGQSLVALVEGAGVSPKDEVYRNAVKYLLATQHADGSWLVRSRSPKFQPYFESGFPYGHDQWISSDGYRLGRYRPRSRA